MAAETIVIEIAYIICSLSSERILHTPNTCFVNYSNRLNSLIKILKTDLNSLITLLLIDLFIFLIFFLFIS